MVEGYRIVSPTLHYLLSPLTNKTHMKDTIKVMERDWIVLTETHVPTDIVRSRIFQRSSLRTSRYSVLITQLLRCMTIKQHMICGVIIITAVTHLWLCFCYLSHIELTNLSDWSNSAVPSHVSTSYTHAHTHKQGRHTRETVKFKIVNCNGGGIASNGVCVWGGGGGGGDSPQLFQRRIWRVSLKLYTTFCRG